MIEWVNTHTGSCDDDGGCFLCFSCHIWGQTLRSSSIVTLSPTLTVSLHSRWQEVCVTVSGRHCHSLAGGHVQLMGGYLGETPLFNKQYGLSSYSSSEAETYFQEARRIVFDISTIFHCWENSFWLFFPFIKLTLHPSSNLKLVRSSRSTKTNIMNNYTVACLQKYPLTWHCLLQGVFCQRHLVSQTDSRSASSVELKNRGIRTIATQKIRVTRSIRTEITQDISNCETFQQDMTASSAKRG